jgi:hypothetical protein
MLDRIQIPERQFHKSRDVFGFVVSVVYDRCSWRERKQRLPTIGNNYAAYHRTTRWLV